MSFHEFPRVSPSFLVTHEPVHCWTLWKRMKPMSPHAFSLVSTSCDEFPWVLFTFHEFCYTSSTPVLLHRFYSPSSTTPPVRLCQLYSSPVLHRIEPPSSTTPTVILCQLYSSPVLHRFYSPSSTTPPVILCQLYSSPVLHRIEPPSSTPRVLHCQHHVQRSPQFHSTSCDEFP